MADIYLTSLLGEHVLKLTRFVNESVLKILLNRDVEAYLCLFYAYRYHEEEIVYLDDFQVRKSVVKDMTEETCGVHVVLSGVVVIMLATGPKVRGFRPGRGRWISKSDKNP
jgi:hypothetical protein